MNATIDAYQTLRALLDGRHRLPPRLVVEMAVADLATALAVS